MLAGYDTYIDTEVGVDTSADLQSEMSVILVLAAIVIVLVLTLTSRSYAEVPVLIMTFGAAALLNMGTNFLVWHHFLYLQLRYRYSAAGTGH